MERIFGNNVHYAVYYLNYYTIFRPYKSAEANSSSFQTPWNLQASKATTVVDFKQPTQQQQIYCYFQNGICSDPSLQIFFNHAGKTFKLNLIYLLQLFLYNMTVQKHIFKPDIDQQQIPSRDIF